jgi:hypothetical protein
MSTRERKLRKTSNPIMESKTNNNRRKKTINEKKQLFSFCLAVSQRMRAFTAVYR